MLTMISVDEHLADGEWTSVWLQRDADKGARHRSGAGQKQWPTFLNVPGKLVAHRILAHVRAVVADADGDRRRAATAAGGAKVDAYQLRKKWKKNRYQKA